MSPNYIDSLLIKPDDPFDLQGICKDHSIKWSILSSHKHSSGESIEVCHVGCNMYGS